MYYTPELHSIKVLVYLREMKSKETGVTLVYNLDNSEVYTKQVRTTNLAQKLIIAVVMLLVLSLILAIGIHCS